MLQDNAHLEAVIAVLRRAALGDASWETAMTAVSDACGGTSCNLVGVEDGLLQFFWSNNLDPAMLEDLGAAMNDNVQNPRLRVSGRAPVMQLVEGIDYGSDQLTRRFPVYGEVCRRYDLGNGVLANLEATDTGMVGVAILRGRRQGHGSTDDRKAVTALIPHLIEAVKIRRMIEDQGSLIALNALETASIAAFLCDRWGRVQRLTPLAAELVGTGGPLVLKGAQLSCRDDAQNRALAGAVARSAGDPAAPQSVLVVGSPQSDKRLVLEVAALPLMGDALGFTPRILITARRKRVPASNALISAILNLTPAEAEVARRLACGDDRQIIARRRGVTVETVRSQLKTIFIKVGVSREAELISKVHQIS